MSHANRTMAVAACCLILASVTRRAHADEPLKQRFLAEAPARWAELDRASKHVEGTYTKSIVHSPESKPPSFARCTFAINDANVKVASEFAEKPGEKAKMVRVESNNQKYIFQINRPPISPDYAISFLEPGDSRGDPVHLEKIAGIIEEHKDNIFCPWYLLGRPLSAWLNDPGLKITSVDLAEVEGQKVARVKFDYASAKDLKDKLSNSHVDLDIEGHWTIRGYLARRPWGTMEAKLTYGNPVDGIPAVKSKEEILEGGGAKVIRTLKMENFFQKEVPASAFTLSAYNLPEPNFNAGYNSFFYWYLSAAVILGVITILLMRKRPSHGAAPSM